MSEKAKIASYWATSCGGCDVAVLDTNVKVLDLAAAADIVFWPVAIDFKTSDVERMEDGYIDLCLFNGSIRSEENAHMASLLRRKSKVLVAFGTCACAGGIHGLINVTDTAAIKETVFAGVPSAANPERSMPASRTPVRGGELTLPALFDAVRPLDRVVDVDYYVPGCPPAVSRVAEILDVYLSGALPPRGSVLGASDKAQCETCPRESCGKTVSKFQRPHLVLADEKRCFLEQGIVCLGPVTRSGCGEQCIRANMPCTGCYGPTPGTVDPGGAMIGVLATMVEARTDEDAKAGFDGIVDPLGSLYLFTMARSLMQRVKRS